MTKYIILGALTVIVGLLSDTIIMFLHFVEKITCYIPIEFRYLFLFIIFNLIFKLMLKGRI